MAKHNVKNRRIWATLLLLLIPGGMLIGATALNYHAEKGGAFSA